MPLGMTQTASLTEQGLTVSKRLAACDQAVYAAPGRPLLGSSRWSKGSAQSAEEAPVQALRRQWTL